MIRKEDRGMLRNRSVVDSCSHMTIISEIIYKNDWSEIDVTLKELKCKNIKLIFNFDYWPINHYQVNLLTTTLKLLLNFLIYWEKVTIMQRN